LRGFPLGREHLSDRERDEPLRPRNDREPSISIRGCPREPRADVIVQPALTRLSLPELAIGVRQCDGCDPAVQEVGAEVEKEARVGQVRNRERAHPEEPPDSGAEYHELVRFQNGVANASSLPEGRDDRSLRCVQPTGDEDGVLATHLAEDLGHFLES